MLDTAIVLSAGAFGYIYLFSTMLKELNKYWLKKEKIPKSFYFINGFIFVGSFLTYGFLLYNYAQYNEYLLKEQFFNKYGPSPIYSNRL
jgi:hypothetical protein